jgi:hypothetical protein
MPGKILATGSSVQCPHGGQATLTTSNNKVAVTTGRALLESDIHTVVGCPFTIGSKPSPCIRIEWSAGANSVSVNGTPVLIQSSIGKCYSPESAVQGVAIIVNSDSKGSAQ